MTKTERRAALRNYALSGFAFGLVTEGMRFAAWSSPYPYDTVRFITAIIFTTLVGLLVGVVVLRFENRFGSERRRLRKKLPDQDNAAL